jgi:hypothetical protein
MAIEEAITLEDLVEALEDTRASVSRKERVKYDQM